MVKYQGHHTFYSRNSSGKYPLDVSKLRNLFGLQESVIQRIKNFRVERLTHMEEIKKNAETFFEEIRRIGDKANWDIPLRTELIASSSVTGGIIDFAEKEYVDLIVVGTRGPTSFKKLLLGSVASSIVPY